MTSLGIVWPVYSRTGSYATAGLTQAFVWLNSATAAGSAGAAAIAGWAVGTVGARGGFSVAAAATCVMVVLAVAGLGTLRIECPIGTVGDRGVSSVREARARR